TDFALLVKGGGNQQDFSRLIHCPAARSPKVALHCGQRQAAVLVLSRPAPHRHTQPRRLAGTPATSACVGTSRVTPGPAATIAYAPTVSPGRIVHRAPRLAPISTRVRASQRAWLAYREATAASGIRALRGCMSFVKLTPGPMKTSSPISTPVHTMAWFF